MATVVTTSKTLLGKVKSGDELGWEEFYHTYKGLIIIVARSFDYRLTDEDISDLIQIVMLDLWKPGKFAYEFGKGVKFRTWFSKIARNKLIDLIRRKSRNPVHEPGPNDPEDWEAHYPVDVFEKTWDQEWKKHLLNQALQQLRLEVEPATYQIFIYCTIHDLPPKEVAAKLGKTVTNVGSAKSRCKERLRSILRDLDDKL